MPAFSASWTENGNVKTVTTKRYTGGWKPSGSSFTTSAVDVDKLNGSTINESKTLAEYLRDNVPSTSRITLQGWGIDGLSSSDMSDTARVTSDYANFNKSVDQLISLRLADSKRGDPVYATYGTAANFGTPPAKKEFLDPATGQPFNSTGTVSDGQTVDVRLTLQNTGETPMPSLRLVDYFGSVRDFEAPSNFRMALNGANVPLTGAAIPSYTQVKSNHDDQDTSTPEDPANTRDDGQVSYRINYGQLGASSSGTLAALNKTQLEPGQTLSFTFRIKASRNRTLAANRSDVDNGNFNRSQGVGSTASPQPSPTADPGGGSVDIGDAHTYASYQSDFCDPTRNTNQNLDFNPGDVVAPALYAQRGSVFSNSNVTGYSSGATYTVTAAGNITKFVSADAINGTQEGYSSTTRQRTGCTINSPFGGLDWRRAMIDNIAALKAGATTGIGPSSSGTIALGAGTVYQSAGDLTLSGNAFSGVGTIIVNGNLTITGNLGYATPQASVGFIVLGNVTFGDAVSQAVGSYYVSDVDYANPPVLDSNGCPKLNVNKGKVTTTKVPLQLKIDGLMVARYFDFGRYYANPQGVTSANALAEQVYYDGRVLNTVQTPPGFTSFARNTSWYEVSPGQ